MYPDFTHPQAFNYWSSLIDNFHKVIAFDGLWIDMNEPSNFVHGSTSGCHGNENLDHPPFVPSNQISHVQQTDTAYLPISVSFTHTYMHTYTHIHTCMHTLTALPTT